MPDVDISHVDLQWESLRESNPSYVDGDIYHVLGVHRNGHGGATIQCAITCYRFYAVGNCGIKPLGVKGICDNEGKLLLGLRSSDVHAYKGMWEFAPSGTVEPHQSLEENILRELQEETGLAVQDQPIAVGVFFDEDASTWEVVYKFEVVGETNNSEYDELQFWDVKSFPSPLTSASLAMRSLI